MTDAAMTPATADRAADGHGAATVAARSVVLPAPARGNDLRVRISAPTTGELLPVVVFSHGFALSGDAYGPLVDAWTAAGFAVLQPTHLDAAALALPPEDPRTPRVWRHRIDDLRLVIDHLDDLGAALPSGAGRLDGERVAVAGHSWGGQSASALLGARAPDGPAQPGEDLADPRVRAGVLLSVTGTGGADLTPFAAEHFPFMHPDFTGMTTPALVVAGDADRSPLTTRGPGWFTDAHRLSPAPGSLLTVVGAEHHLGGIQGAGAESTGEEVSPGRVALVQRVTTAYLRSALDIEDDSWAAQRVALADGADPLGRLDSR